MFIALVYFFLFFSSRGAGLGKARNYYVHKLQIFLLLRFVILNSYVIEQNLWCKFKVGYHRVVIVSRWNAFLNYSYQKYGNKLLWDVWKYTSHILQTLYDLTFASRNRKSQIIAKVRSSLLTVRDKYTLILTPNEFWKLKDWAPCKLRSMNR